MLSSVCKRDVSTDVAPKQSSEIVKMYRSNNNKLGVPDMRKYMKTMVAEIFFDQKYSPEHKCRGIWKTKPVDWPAVVPFCDPNNSENPKESHKKPKKPVLTEMMKYLVDKYEERESMTAEAPKMTSGGKALMQTSDWQEHESNQAVQDFNIDQPKLQETLASMQPDDYWVTKAPSMPATEESDVGVMQENGPFDLVLFCEKNSGAPSPAYSVQPVYEEGGSPKLEINYNVQASQSDDDNDVTRMACNFTAPPAVAAPPPHGPDSPAFPPPRNDMDGLPVSNGGHLGTLYDPSFGCGIQTEEEVNLDEYFAGIDLSTMSLFDDNMFLQLQDNPVLEADDLLAQADEPMAEDDGDYNVQPDIPTVVEHYNEEESMCE